MASPSFNIRDHGAVGDGIALDSPAINAAINAAADAGGGTVVFPAGTYLSFSVRLRSHITLHLESGATLLAATPAADFGSYDPILPNRWGDELQYQDFGHSHWRNSLIWGEDLTDIAITGLGLIDGLGLKRHANYPHVTMATGPNGTAASGSAPRPAPSAAPSLTQGNKAIALKNCRNVILRDFSLHRGGHFALLATGVDDLAITGLTLDTNRDGLDIDGCRRVTITDCTVNTPNDDAIVLKTSYALGELRPCEDITIRDCHVSGFDLGTVLDGTFGRTTERSPDRDGPTGRIKIGTESNGDFRRITIDNCTFRRSRGLALETVDGATIEDVTASNLTMQEVTNAPIFLRIGNRARGPEGTPIGQLRRVVIRDITADDVDGRFPIILAGLPGHPIEDVTLANIRVTSRGGITMADVAAQADTHVNAFFLRGDEPGVTGPRDPFTVPERERGYPEPSMFGLLPASALYARHVRDLNLRNVTVTINHPDERPPVVLDDAPSVTFVGGNLTP
ncbi:rhamnogalacturonidase [Synoicihabitans lomoniglobus]|uniref:Glycosyl hydrolase family 28-related protein n=1 Tax=Synoicihabitans lomoniglobus TaxID=2909285 RepID=A0AAE9ZWP5_9BACT|nr:glycoside hydrolase family 28 protein [Opitutaceae bacterium LMO-M01]WED64270.1 glycosyl hydrolase family 28-related protein [Opitutaceae bacterium LMO-M01]